MAQAPLEALALAGMEISSLINQQSPSSLSLCEEGSFFALKHRVDLAVCAEIDARLLPQIRLAQRVTRCPESNALHDGDDGFALLQGDPTKKAFASLVEPPRPGAECILMHTHADNFTFGESELWRLDQHVSVDEA